MVNERARTMAHMTGELDGRTVLVTGGSMGIGYACAFEVLARGARVVIAARGTTAMNDAVDRLGASAPGRVIGVSADVSVPESVDRLLERVKSVGSLAGVIHAAGTYGPIGPIHLSDPTSWFDAVRTNLFGTMLITRAACGLMRETGLPGSIVLLAGGGAASPFPNYSAYASSKVAVVRLAETVALEVAELGIRVNALAPGFVATRLHQETMEAGTDRAGAFYETTKARLAQGAVAPEVAAKAAAFLLSDRARSITGRFLAAPYDEIERLPEHLEELRDSDLFTLRRIVPRDRGLDWQ
jgi:NAD(P)-dependent dehydrogenase (short-subunit alcohol dehydrogenase family)